MVRGAGPAITPGALEVSDEVWHAMAPAERDRQARTGRMCEAFTGRPGERAIGEVMAAGCWACTMNGPDTDAPVPCGTRAQRQADSTFVESMAQAWSLRVA